MLHKTIKKKKEIYNKTIENKVKILYNVSSKIRPPKGERT